MHSGQMSQILTITQSPSWFCFMLTVKMSQIHTFKTPSTASVSKEEQHVMNIFLSITSSTCTLGICMQDSKNGDDEPVGPHRGVARPLLGPTRPCQVTMVHVKHPKVILHPWITLVFSLKGGGSSHKDSWAHKRSNPT